MKTPLGLLNLQHQLTRTIVSTCGVGFALLLVFMQLGFQGAVSHTATNVYENLEFDLLLRGANYVHLYEPGRLPRRNLNVAAGAAGVAEVVPFWIGLQNWRSLPPELHPRRLSVYRPQFLPLAIMGLEPRQRVFDLPEINAKQVELSADYRVLVDDSTRADYGPLDGRRFTDADRGRTTEIAGREVEIAGVFELGTGLAANAAILTSARGFDRMVPWNAHDEVSLGLVRLRPDAHPQTVAENLRRLLGTIGPSDQVPQIEVLTRREAIEWERQRWLWETPIGLIFQLGVALSLLVGAAIVYMVLATDVTDRLSEYATLLAMGYSRLYLCSVVITQALALGVGGFLLAWGISEILYRVTEQASGIPISMNVGRIVGVALLGAGVCLVSGVLVLRKVWKAEPASLF
jgi:putative ABC transport system permease protein